ANTRSRHSLPAASGGFQALIDRGKHRLQGAVGTFFSTGRTVGVGHVGSHRIEPDGLGSHGAAGNVVNGVERHGAISCYCPSMALRRPEIFMFRNVRLVWNSMALAANWACSTPSSAVLPSPDGCMGTRNFRSLAISSLGMGADPR